MRKFMVLAAITSMLVVPLPANASAFGHRSRCILTDDGRVFFTSTFTSQDASWSYYEPITHYVFRKRPVDLSDGWTRISTGYRKLVVVEPDGDWYVKFRTSPLPRAGMRYRLNQHVGSYEFFLGRYYDDRPTYCRQRT